MPTTGTEQPTRITLSQPKKDITAHLRYLRYNASVLEEMGLFHVETTQNGGEECGVYSHQSGATLVTHSYGGGLSAHLIVGGKKSDIQRLVSLIEEKWCHFGSYK